MDYAYAVKRLPQPNELTAGDPAANPPPEPQPPQEDDARPWAGDVYDEGDETDPALAYASFSGQDGEQAWLDKAEDGTLTGWVRDETGQVWRYSDPDTWAIDVDDAGMVQTSGTNEAPSGDEAPQAPTGEDPAADDTDGSQFGTADEVVTPDEDLGDDMSEEPDPFADDPDDETDEDNEDEPDPKGKKPWK
ncbi:hypothetical protein [Streptomyces tirandamycinicus]|uniref:Uncharacterized protein n=1 Tax=Streptomyces tirandamycinicus TaxID=2174846 RepID=A0A2S1T208_9ACTN|nr:hypothetical protein [Streptomyces tirandamycinicus]AWI32702.1 hypothetical protein DDW44_30780 [Streptomyces tirandamycinicus]